MADEQREGDRGIDDLNRTSRDKGKAKVEEPSNVTSSDQSMAANADDEDYFSSTLLYDSPTKKRRLTEQEQVMDQNINRLSNIAILNDTPNPFRPGSRVMSVDNLRITKTLHEYDVVPENPSLLIDPEEASILADDPDFALEPAPLNYQKTLLAFDEYDRQFNLLFTIRQHNKGAYPYKVTGGWGVFVNMHKLKRGDVIMFYKYKDDKVSNDYYYALRYFRKPKPESPKPVIKIKKRTGGADGDKEKRTGGSDDDKLKGRVVVGHWG